MIDLQPTGSFIALLSTELHDLKRSAQKRSFPAGQVIFKQGDPGDGVYLVDEGGIEISTLINDDEERVLSHLGEGTYFGEMAVLDDQPRSATATAKVDSIVSFIPRDEMLRALAHSPELLTSLVKEFSLRTRQFDRRYINEILEAERLTLIGRFAQSIVHDFKNPLNIIGFAAALATQDDTPSEHRAEAKVQIARQLDRMTYMINELLEFTRGSSREVTLEPTEYRAFVDEFLTSITPEAAEKAVKLVFDLPPAGVLLALDRSRLLQVFYNLVNNAIDMMPAGGAITLRFSVHDNEIVTELEDTGPGLAPEIQARLFQPFATHGKSHGTGLGLSICKRIIEDHHGRIHARGEPGRGAVFSFTLPRPAAVLTN
ncbi:MAG: cyclic nucleotide-binding domain-containing protein [Chthoniobacter sp.]|nr:cyclic nucleotide-binding domain-containing protein [Chthoniobacter sp.]